MKNFTLLVLLSAIVCSQASSQSTLSNVINSSGGAYASDSYSYEWSIGELVLVNEMVEKDGKYILTNGFLQPYSHTGKPITPEAFKNHELRLLQNPVKDALGVLLTTNERGKLKLKVYDERGYVKYYNVIPVNGDVVTQYINLFSCASGNYFLRAEFTSNDQTKKYKEGTFKFIKIH
jgi:hypothetical protein